MRSLSVVWSMRQNFVIINIIMGNIQVVQPSSKRRSIFSQIVRPPIRRSRSPRMAPPEEDTHRFTNNNRVYKIRDSDGEDTSRHRNGNYYRVSENRVERNNILIDALERSQSNNHSNKVVNFNDFLIEIKKQMTENSNNYSDVSSQFDNTLKRGGEQQKQKAAEPNKELKVNLKLENERFQLDKYKKLVERELSKSHSIENISLQSKQQNEKLLIIKYGQYGKEQKTNHSALKSHSKTSNMQERSQIVIQNNHLNQKIQQEKAQYSEILKKAQRMMRELTQRMEGLNQFIEGHEQPQEGVKKNEQNQVRNVRISRISGLMSDINHLQASQMALQNQIKAAIEVGDESEISETLTEGQLAKIEQRR